MLQAEGGRTQESKTRGPSKSTLEMTDHLKGTQCTNTEPQVRRAKSGLVSLIWTGAALVDGVASIPRQL